jgi:hypothetical protein
MCRLGNGCPSPVDRCGCDHVDTVVLNVFRRAEIHKKQGNGTDRRNDRRQRYRHKVSARLFAEGVYRLSFLLAPFL